MSKKLFVVVPIEITGKGQQKSIRVELPKNAKRIVGVKVDSNVNSDTFPANTPYIPPIPTPQSQLVNVTNLEQVNWTNIIGNSNGYVYYTTPDPINNPSGAKNLKELIYYKNGIALFKEVYKYDIDNDIVEIKCVAP